MRLGRVIGNVVSTNKEDALVGYKLLIVRLENSLGTDETLVAVDRLGAGIGTKVLVTLGSSARIHLGSSMVPTDAAIVGIVDE